MRGFEIYFIINEMAPDGTLVEAAEELLRQGYKGVWLSWLTLIKTMNPISQKKYPNKMFKSFMNLGKRNQ